MGRSSSTERISSFAHAADLQALPVKFVYEGHRVKVEVTGAKKIEIPIPAV